MDHLIALYDHTHWGILQMCAGALSQNFISRNIGPTLGVTQEADGLQYRLCSDT